MGYCYARFAPSRCDNSDVNGLLFRGLYLSVKSRVSRVERSAGAAVVNKGLLFRGSRLDVN